MTTAAIVDDATLVSGVVSGDAASLAGIYDRYSGPLLGFCQNMLRRPADAEDCLQDVFVIAATRLRDLREPERLRSWLYAVARHECIARLDRRNRELLMDDVPDRASTAIDQPAATALDNELAALLRDMNDGLSDRDRLLLELADREQLTGDELADAVGVPRSTAYTLLMRARLTARNSLAALLVARTGREKCPDLDQLLTGWDGRLTALRRKQIARHIDKCATCTEQRRRVATPAALLGEGTAFAAELVGLRTRILAAAGDGLLNGPVSAGHWTGGWPPSDLVSARRRRWWLPLAILLGVLLLVGGGSAIVLTQGDSGTVAAPSALTSSVSPTTSAVTTSSAATPSTSSISITPFAGVPVAPAAPAGKIAPPTPSATPTSKATTSAAPSSSAPPTWVVSLTASKRGAALISVNNGAAQTCDTGLTCKYTVPNRASVRVAGRAGTFTAPASCAAIRTGGVCTITVTANVQVTLT